MIPHQLIIDQMRTAEMLVALYVRQVKHENDLFHRMLRLYVRHPDFQVRLVRC